MNFGITYSGLLLIFAFLFVRQIAALLISIFFVYYIQKSANFSKGMKVVLTLLVVLALFLIVLLGPIEN